MDKCEFCLKHDDGNCVGIFDFKLLCCRVRWLLGVPHREIALGWLDLWRNSRNIGHDATEETRRVANRLINERKDTAKAKTD